MREKHEKYRGENLSDFPKVWVLNSKLLHNGCWHDCDNANEYVERGADYKGCAGRSEQVVEWIHGGYDCPAVQEHEADEARQVVLVGVGLHVEEEEEGEAEGAGHAVVEQVPHVVGDPVGVGLEAADELELFRVGLALAEQEEEEAGGREREGEEEADGDGQVDEEAVLERLQELGPCVGHRVVGGHDAVLAGHVGGQFGAQYGVVYYIQVRNTRVVAFEDVNKFNLMLRF